MQLGNLKLPLNTSGHLEAQSDSGALHGSGYRSLIPFKVTPDGIEVQASERALRVNIYTEGSTTPMSAKVEPGEWFLFSHENLNRFDIDRYTADLKFMDYWFRSDRPLTNRVENGLARIVMGDEKEPLSQRLRSWLDGV